VRPRPCRKPSATSFHNFSEHAGRADTHRICRGILQLASTQSALPLPWGFRAIIGVRLMGHATSVGGRRHVRFRNRARVGCSPSDYGVTVHTAIAAPNCACPLGYHDFVSFVSYPISLPLAVRSQFPPGIFNDHAALDPAESSWGRSNPRRAVWPVARNAWLPYCWLIRFSFTLIRCLVYGCSSFPRARQRARNHRTRFVQSPSKSAVL